MQYFESTNFFLRVIVFDFFDECSRTTIRLLPMCHIGEKDFYEGILKEINQCDKVLYEGLSLKKFKINKQDGRYENWAKRLDLVSQFEYFQNQKKRIKTELIHADLSGEKAENEWSKLSFREKFKYRFIEPIEYFFQSYNMTRERLAKLNMTAAKEARLAYAPAEIQGNLEYLIGKARDKLVISKLNEIVNDKLNSGKTIGIMYGANHMKRIGRFLIDTLKMKISDARFLVVFHL